MAAEHLVRGHHGCHEIQRSWMGTIDGTTLSWTDLWNSEKLNGCYGRHNT